MRLAGRLDSDLAALYEVPTMVFNQTIQRNAARFPVYFAFQPTREKVANLKSQFVTSKWWRWQAKEPVTICDRFGIRSQIVTLNVFKVVANCDHLWEKGAKWKGKWQ